MQHRAKVRIAYLSGPVDAFDVYDKWSKDQQLAYFGTSHVSDFFQVCSELGLESYLITTLPGTRSQQQNGHFLIENRPTPTQYGGILYHLTAAWWLIGLLPSLFRFRPDVLILTAGFPYVFFLAILTWWRNIVIIPALTGTLWPKFAPLRMSWRFSLYMNRLFFARCVSSFMVMSEDIAEQVRKLMRDRAVPIAVFLPTYRREQFSTSNSANFHARPFRVLFAGRIEKNKGVYDLVTIAQRLEHLEPGTFHFDICGEGSELESLQQRVEHLGMASVITCHGFCARPRLTALLNESSVVIVPTTTEFEEGFNMVCAEAILAGRPLITSAVCPALAYVKNAAIEVQPDNVQEYGDAILTLAHDKSLYESKRLACKSAQEQFYDMGNGWGAKLKEALARHLQLT